MISNEVFRIKIGLQYSCHAKVKGIEHFNYFELLIIMSLLLIGGIERILAQHLNLLLAQIPFYPKLNISLKINFLLYIIMFRASRIS